MKIGLNATCFNERPSGAKQRFIGIYSELIASMPNDQFFIYEPSDCTVSGWFSNFENVLGIKAPFKSTKASLLKIIQANSYWDLELSKREFSIFERFNMPVVRAPLCSNLMTIHDVRWLSSGNLIKRFLYKEYIEHSLKAADCILTVSESMKREILTHFPFLSINVVNNGIDIARFKNVSVNLLNEFKNKYSLPEEFILSVGHLEPRKNYVRLFHAIALLQDRGICVPLVIIGNDSGEREQLIKLSIELGIGNKVYMLDGLSDEEVVCAYQLSILFVFASEYEGFGIPILEAMASKCPMVLSNIPVFREITEGYALYFSYDNVDEMANVIQIGLESRQYREAIIEYGSNRVSNFQFEVVAKQLRNIYDDMS